MTGEWLGHCHACSMPEISNVFQRCGVPFYQVNGLLDEKDRAWDEIREYSR